MHNKNENWNSLNLRSNFVDVVNNISKKQK